ncbi:MAG: hypothetical protein Q9218_000580 [Villophora microphyllina]
MAKTSRAVTIQEIPKMTEVSSSSSARSNGVPQIYEPRILRNDEIDAAAGSLARAFAEDDVAMYFVNTKDTKSWTEERRWKLHLKIMKCIVKAHHLEGLALTIGPNHDCVALWMPPGKTMDGWFTTLRSGMTWLNMWLPEENKRRFQEEFLPLLHDTKRETLGEKDKDSWYLVYIGTRPEGRHKGYARKLVEFVTEKADEDGRLCYLESSNGLNPTIYKKMGFEIIKQIHLTRDPKRIELDIMVRNPFLQATSRPALAAEHHVSTVETLDIQKLASK